MGLRIAGRGRWANQAYNSHQLLRQNLIGRQPSWPERCKERGTTLFPMLETLAIVLVCLWLLGIVSSYTMGGFIHALLIVAFISILVRIIRGDKPFA